MELRNRSFSGVLSSVANGIVYITSKDSNVYALNAENGNKIWSYKTGYEIYSCPAVVNGVVFVGSNDHYLYALNAETGSKIWSYNTGNFVWSFLQLSMVLSTLLRTTVLSH